MAFAHPRSQTVFVSVICIAAVAVALFTTRQGAGSTTNDTTLGAISAANNSDDSSADNTASSSIDWKKSFITGDVTTAGAAVTKSPPSTDTSNEDTMTAYLGKAALTSYMALQNAGLDGDKTSVDNATKKIISSALSYKTPTVYTPSDINATPKSDDVTLTVFKSAVAGSLSLYKITKNEALITRQYLENRDPEVLKQIDPIIRNYTTIIDSLRKIRTPSVISKDMLELINGFSAMKFVAESLRAAKTDPLAAMVGANNYLDGIKQIIESLQNMRKYIESRGGTFTFDGTFVDVMLSNS